MLVRLTGNLIAPGGRFSRLIILMYHRVLEKPDRFLPDDIDAAGFDQQMGILAKNYSVLPLSEAVSLLQRGALPPRAVAVTFDDGYGDNHDVALPILERHGLTATFYIATGFLDGGRMWNDTIIECLRRQDSGVIDLSSIGLEAYTIRNDEDRIRIINTLIGKLKYLPMEKRQAVVDRVSTIVGKPLPRNLMLSSEQVLALFNSGMEIGGHTVNHPILSSLDAAGAEREIVAGRKRLEEIVGKRISMFAYPNGRPGKDYTREHVEILKRNGFDLAVTTSWGCATRDTNRLQLPRIAPWDRTAFRYNIRLLRAYQQKDSESV